MAEPKYALITGATRGIGRAVAHALAGKGYHLALVARSLIDLEDQKRELSALYPHLEIVVRTADLTKSFEAGTVAQTVLNHWPRLDVLVNNVGLYTAGRLGEGDPKGLENSLRANLHAPYHLTLPLLDRFREQRGGAIFNIGSVLGESPRVEAATYTIAKHALLGFSRVLAEELRDQGVKVSYIAPGSVNTSSWDGIEAPLDEFVQPEDVAKAIVTALELSGGAWMEEMTLRPLNRNF